MKNIALIVGSSGQDGYYLSDKLHKEKFEVYGIDLKYTDNDKLKFETIDVTNIEKFNEFLLRLKPTIIYYLAAIHGSSGFKYEENLKLFGVNVTGVHICLEYIRKYKNNCGFIYASSTKALKKNRKGIINERSVKNRDELYSITKNTATDLIDYYKNTYSLNLRTVWFGNHESKFRENTFFSKIIIDGLIKNIINKEIFITKINNLSFSGDWGLAKEYMEILYEISQYNQNTNQVKNYLISTGININARELVDELYKKYNMNYKNYIKEKEPDLNISENIISDNAKIRKIINKKITSNLDVYIEIVNEIINA
jgi:GDPmannose 4,6-dehydratase